MTYAPVDLGLPTGEYVLTIVDPPDDSELGFVESDGTSDTVSKGLGKVVVADVEDGDCVPFTDNKGVGSKVRSSVTVGLGSGVVAAAADGLKVAG